MSLWTRQLVTSTGVKVTLRRDDAYPPGSFTNCIVTKEFSTLDRSKDLLSRYRQCPGGRASRYCSELTGGADPLIPSRSSKLIGVVGLGETSSFACASCSTSTRWIDMQKAFDAPPTLELANVANGLAAPPGDPPAGRSSTSAMTRVQPGSSLAPWNVPATPFARVFEPQGDEPLVTKSVNSAFIGTDLDLRLKRLGAKHVVLFGISTDMCVSTTVRTGANMGWDMILVPDACDCFDMPDGQGGTIPAEEVQRGACRDARLRIRAHFHDTNELTGLRAAA
jgi:nicotinamidase-related amidase